MAKPQKVPRGMSESGETTSFDIVRYAGLCIARAFWRTVGTLKWKGNVGLVPIHWVLGFYLYYWMRGWAGVIDEALVAAAFTFAPVGIVACAVFVASLMTEPVRMYAELGQVLRGLTPTEAPEIVHVTGRLTQNGKLPQLVVTSLVNTEEMSVQVLANMQNWRTRLPPRPSRLAWSNGEKGVRMAEGQWDTIELGRIGINGHLPEILSGAGFTAYPMYEGGCAITPEGHVGEEVVRTFAILLRFLAWDAGRPQNVWVVVTASGNLQHVHGTVKILRSGQIPTRPESREE